MKENFLKKMKLPIVIHFNRYFMLALLWKTQKFIDLSLPFLTLEEKTERRSNDELRCHAFQQSTGLRNQRTEIGVPNVPYSSHVSLHMSHNLYLTSLFWTMVGLKMTGPWDNDANL